jgi:hypothetical protein
LYEEEIIYSAFIRYHLLSGNLSVNKTLEELFECRTASIFTMIPKHLKILNERTHLALGDTVQQVIQKNTIIGLFRPFTESKRYSDILNAIMIGNHRFVNGNLGLTNKDSFFLINSIKLCRDCITEDIELLGEAYLHKEHQVYGNKVCNKHRTMLIEIGLEKGVSSGKEVIDLYTISKQILSTNTSIAGLEDCCYKEFENLSEDLHLLFELSNTDIDGEKTRQKYVSMMIDNNLISSKGFIKQKLVTEIFNKFYSKPFLEDLKCTVEINNGDNWLSRIGMGSRQVINPIKNLLYIRCFFGSLKGFFQYESYEVALEMCNNKIKTGGGIRRTQDDEVWKQKDIELSSKIEQFINEVIKSDEFYDNRITLSLISSSINYPHLFMYLERLPNVQSLLNKYIETWEDFKIRKIDYWIKYMIKYNEPITKSSIIKKANIQNPSNVLNEYIAQKVLNTDGVEFMKHNNGINSVNKTPN